MRILVLASDLGAIGGIQQYNKKFIQGLKDAGEKVQVVELKGAGAWRKTWFALSFLWKVIIFRTDFVICTHLNFSPLAFFAKKLLRRPYSITVYGIEVTAVGSPLKRRALRNARCIVKLFDKTERDVVRQMPELQGRFVTVPNSVDGERFFIGPRSEALLRKYSLQGAKIILTIARLSKSDADGKGYLRVVQAMPQVLKEVPEAKYLLVGGGEDGERAKQLSKDLGVESSLRLSGKVDDKELADHYGLADVFVMPSKNEGFPPIVFLEALACGVPVVGGGQEDSNDPFWREAAIIVPPDDIQKIAEAIIMLLKGSVPPKLKAREGLREAVLRRYGREGYNQSLQAFLENIRNERQDPR